MSDGNGAPTPAPSAPTVIFSLAVHPDGRTAWQAQEGTPVPHLLGLLMQVVVALGQPAPKVIVPPTGVGGFRPLFRGRG